SINRGVNNRILTPLNQVRGQAPLTTLSAAQMAAQRTATQQFRAASVQRSQVERPDAGLTAGRRSGMANAAEMTSFFAGPGSSSRAGSQPPANGNNLRAGRPPAGPARNAATGGPSAGHAAMPHFQAPSTRSFAMPRSAPAFSRPASTFRGGGPARSSSS